MNIQKPFHAVQTYLARQYTKLYSSNTFIGVTGLFGKTTFIIALDAVLSTKYKTITTNSPVDSISNIQSTLLKLKPNVKKVILEMKVASRGDMDFYLSLVRPNTAVVTKISIDRSEFLGGLEDIIGEVGKLIEQLPASGLAILNGDDIHSKRLAQICKAQIIYFGLDSTNCSVWAGNIRVENFKTIFELNYGVERVRVEYQLLGEHQIYAALAAASLGIAEDIPLIKIKKALEKVTPVEHKLMPIQGPSGSIVLDDTYDASPASVEAAINTLVQIPSRRKILVLGEIRDLGQFSENYHKEVAKLIYKEKLDLVLLGTGDTKYIAEELLSLGYWDEKLQTDLQHSQIVSQLLKNLGKGDLCLIKGSRAVRLDEVVKRVSKKT